MAVRVVVDKVQKLALEPLKALLENFLWDWTRRTGERAHGLLDDSHQKAAHALGQPNKALGLT